MEGFSFPDWLKAMGLTKAQAAQALGISAVYASMLCAHPRAGHYRTPSHALALRCREVARQRMAEIAPYAEMGESGVSCMCQHIHAVRACTSSCPSAVGSNETGAANPNAGIFAK